MQLHAARRFPWYDSWWLTRYARAREIIRSSRPDALESFDAAFAPLHTRRSFQTRLLERVLDDDTMRQAQAVVRALQPTDLELHDAQNFGRFVVHGHPFFTELQTRLSPLVSEAVGEAVEPAYNILSLYTAKGTCRVHLDAPSAKWTLDLCLAQTTPWPIHFSQVMPWPEQLSDWSGADWEAAIKQSPELRFDAYTLQPGQAVIFSGSSQWHYRDPFPAAAGYCHLVFLHFLPSGMGALLNPRRWPESFGVPALSVLSDGNIE